MEYKVWHFLLTTQARFVQHDESDESKCNQVNHLIPTRVLVKGGEITCKMLK